MIDYETFCQIRLLAQEKDLKASQIAAELGLDLKTVEKWLRGGMKVVETWRFENPFSSG